MHQKAHGQTGLSCHRFVPFGGATGPLGENRKGESGASRGLGHAAPLGGAGRDGELMEKGGEDEPVSVLGGEVDLTDAVQLGAIPGYGGR